MHLLINRSINVTNCQPFSFQQNVYPDALNLPNVPPSQSYGTQPLDLSVDNMSNNLKVICLYKIFVTF